MPEIIIKPQFGEKEESNNITFIIDKIPKNNGIRIKIENVTNSVLAVLKPNNSNLIQDNYIYYFNNISKVQFNADLNIPEYSSDSIISLFVYIERKNENDDFYKLIKICPVSFYIKEKKKSNKFKGNIYIDPVFIDENEFCSIRINSIQNFKTIIFINDKKFDILTNDQGNGSISFRGKDILNNSISIPHKFSIFYWNEKEEKKESILGHVYILPSSLKTSAEIDPRCLIPGYVFTIPEACLEEEPPSIPTGPPGSFVPPIDLPVKRDNCADISLKISDACRIHKVASTLLSNGMVLHAVISSDSSITDPDSFGYNKNRIFIIKDESSLDTNIITIENIIVPQKARGDPFEIFVEKDTWDKIKRGQEIYVLIFNEIFGYKGFHIIGTAIDEYSNFYKLILQESDGLFSTIEVPEWLSCELAVFFEKNEDENGVSFVSDIKTDLIEKMPFIVNHREAINIVNVSLGSNIEYIEDNKDEIFYVYVIAEAIINDKSQLFYYSFSIGEKEENFSHFGWKQLTFLGNNKNPKCKVDKNNNLHIFWESDRTGLTQIYYGILGPSVSLIGNNIISSILDKQAELFSKEIISFDYVKDNILIESDIYIDQSIIENNFIINIRENGIVTMDDPSIDKGMSISANTMSDMAMVFTSLNEDNGFNLGNGTFNQINFQINFDFSGEINQDLTLDEIRFDVPLEKSDIDILYNTWKEKFSVRIDENFSKTPIYFRDNNKFVIGKEENIYDRIIPIIGSYENSNIIGIAEREIIDDEFEVIFSGTNKNVKHFMLGIMPEKIRFKATNVQGLVEYCSNNNVSIDDCNEYIDKEENIIYTGRAKFVILLNVNNDYYGNIDRGKFEIIRKLPKIINLNEINKLKILINYSKLNCETMKDIFGSNIDPNPLLNEYLFSCNLIILINDIIEFSESFVTDLSGDYKNFDIGFGIPSGGRFVTNEFFPYETSIYDNVNVTLIYEDISISSPTFMFNDEIINVPIFVRDITSLIVAPDISGFPDEGKCSSFFDTSDLLTLSFLEKTITLDPSIVIDTTDTVNSNDFFQAPITLEGINQSVNLDLGICNDLHIVWESNRNKYWNIFYANSLNRNIPFRIEEMITNTKSNSLVPNISVNRNGKRMIVWHDNRNGKYDIYAARSLEGYDCNCGNYQEIILAEEIGINFCNLLFSYTPVITKVYNFKFNFYTDSNFIHLFKSISSLDDIEGWKSNDIPFTENGVELIAGISVDIIYVPKRGDGIFDKLLYVKGMSI